MTGQVQSPSGPRPPTAAEKAELQEILGIALHRDTAVAAAGQADQAATAAATSAGTATVKATEAATSATAAATSATTATAKAAAAATSATSAADSMTVATTKAAAAAGSAAAAQQSAAAAAAAVTDASVATAIEGASLANLARIQYLVSGVAIKESGLTVTVTPFVVGGFAAAGGSISMPAAGTWYVGVEMWSNQVRVLPRLGHRGWVPVAKVSCTGVAIMSLQQIAPQTPPCRIPRSMAKVLSGKQLNVLVMGSSLTASGGASTDWPGMVFGAGTAEKYKLPTTVSAKYLGVGASPNQYQLAQLGFASSHTAYGFTSSGVAGAISGKAAPNGRSAVFSSVDLVVIGCLANGGDYRLECIEPIVRKLRQRGVEVVMITDNQQGPSTDYATMAAAGLYGDGAEVMRVADLYGVEVADTAAYVFEAHLRAGGVGIYGDAIHQATGAPSGVTTLLPANGHEAYARAVRSIFSASVVVSAPTVTTLNHDFAGGVQGWRAWANGSAGSATASSGALVATKTSSAATQWGLELPLPAQLTSGDTVQFSGTFALGSAVVAQAGTVGGVWSSNTLAVNASGSFSGTFALTGPTSGFLLLANPDGAPIGATFSVDNVTLVITKASSVAAQDATPGRAVESRQIPPIRVVTDTKTPSDAFVILPADELYLGNSHAAKGTLGAHPWGGSSFARRFSGVVGASSDLLTLTAGKKACVSADVAVGLSLIHYRDAADGTAVVNVNVNGATQKVLTFAAAPFANEWYATIYTPTEAGVSSPTTQLSVELEVVTGTLKIAALVALTGDVEFVLPEQITYVGSGWLPKESSRSGLPGRPTDTAGNYALLKGNGRRLLWILSANPGSKPVNIWSDNELLSGVAVAGNYHIHSYGTAGGNGANHVVYCAETNASGSQANGRALHVGGAIVVNDR